MPTSPVDRQSGFTLLELMAVLMILALSATAVLQVGRASADTAQVRSFLIEAEALMREARTSAIETMAQQDVMIDVKSRTLGFAAGRRLILVPASLELDGKLAKLDTAPEEGGFVIRFFPTGSSTGANLPFRFRDQVYELRVNWLTGHADVRRG